MPPETTPNIPGNATDAAMDAAGATLGSAQESLSILEQLKIEGVHIFVTMGTKIVVAILIIVVGFWLARRSVRLLDRVMKARDMDETLRPFLKSTVGFLVKAVVLIVAISTLGVEMTSIIAVLGSIGLAIGLALQGSLSNFAGGILILTLKPFKKGEFIEAQGVSGKVEEISVISTTLLTVDNKTAFLPNGPLAGGTIINYTRQSLRRVDMSFGVDYGDDIEKARAIILNLALSHEYALEEPAAPFVRVSTLADSSVNFAVRVWTKTENYWDLYHYMLENVKREFDAEGISIPFPQRTLHMVQQK